VALAKTSVRTDTGRVLTMLYQEHAAEAFRYALHLTGRRPDAEDIVQQVFLQAHRHLERGRDLVSPRAWLLTAVKHRAFNLARDRREIPLEEAAAGVQRDEPARDEAAELAEVRGMLWTLPEAQHQAFVLRHWSGLSQNEIADVLETTPSAVESLLVRARSALLRSHDSATAACTRVRGRLLDSTVLGASDEAHLGACRPCGQARARLARGANLAGSLALLP
jgi:RNA polymerase sigma-70 factor, ECF subfamily